jgi:hypothetical protein
VVTALTWMVRDFQAEEEWPEMERHGLAALAPTPAGRPCVGAALAQIDALHLGEGARLLVAVAPPEGADIGRGIGHILNDAIQCHQPQSKAKGSWRLGGGQRPTHAVEQRHHRACPQAIARLTDRALARQGDLRIRPEQTQPMHQLVQHHTAAFGVGAPLG